MINLQEFEPILKEWFPRIVRIFIILLISFVVWRIFGIFSNRLTKKAIKSRGKGSSQRAATLGKIVKNIINIGLSLLVFTLILDEIGFQIGPILAAAGVVGIAIGFGAQSLVKDMLNGFFLLVEGQIKIGDWIEAGGKSGHVEDITLRVLTLRDLGGNVHIIPHGEIATITNMTKNYSVMMVDIGVAYKENADQVMEILKEASELLRNDPVNGKLILKEAEVLGIQEFADSSINFRVRMRVRPGEQWNIGRAYRKLVKEMFDEKNVEIPFPHRTVYMRNDSQVLKSV